MKRINKFLAAFICLLSLANNLYARTCAEKLRTRAKLMVAGAVGSTLLVPVVGYGGIFMWLAVKEKLRLIRDAKRLEAAYTIAHNSSGPDLGKAQSRFEKFYRRLIELYPETSMSKAEVLDILNKINFYEFGAGACTTLKSSPLSCAFFPEKTRDNWLVALKEERERTARQVEAARIRDRLNSTPRASGENAAQDDEFMVEIDR